MSIRAVVFDLFGTLVRSVTRREYDQVNARMAKAGEIPFPELEPCLTGRRRIRRPVF